MILLRFSFRFIDWIIAPITSRQPWMMSVQQEFVAVFNYIEKHFLILHFRFFFEYYCIKAKEWLASFINIFSAKWTANWTKNWDTLDGAKHIFYLFIFTLKFVLGPQLNEKKNKQNVERRSKVEAGRKWKHKHYWCNKKSEQESDNLCLMYIACKIEVSQKSDEKKKTKISFFFHFIHWARRVLLRWERSWIIFQKKAKSKFRSMLAIFGSLVDSTNTRHVRVMCLVWGHETFLVDPSV